MRWGRPCALATLPITVSSATIGGAHHTQPTHALTSLPVANQGWALTNFHWAAPAGRSAAGWPAGLRRHEMQQEGPWRTVGTCARGQCMRARQARHKLPVTVLQCAGLTPGGREWRRQAHGERQGGGRQQAIGCSACKTGGRVTWLPAHLSVVQHGFHSGVVRGQHLQQLGRLLSMADLDVGAAPLGRPGRRPRRAAALGAVVLLVCLPLGLRPGKDSMGGRSACQTDGSWRTQADRCRLRAHGGGWPPCSGTSPC